MIAVDTNIVLRRLLQDDAAQAAKANELFDRESEILITDVVLAEVVWVLGGHRCNLTREQVAQAITSLFREPAARFESVAVVWDALQDYIEATPTKRRGKTHVAGFADAIIARKATEVMAHAGEASPVTYTFDIGAQQLPGTKAL